MYKNQKEMKLSLLTNGRIGYVENPKEYLKINMFI